MNFFTDILQYEFLRNALLAAVLTSITCGIVGTYVVSRRIVFISGGITHASFGGIGLGHYLGIDPLIGAVVFSIFSALGIEYFSKKTIIREDSVIAILWSFGMALGIIFIFLTPGYSSGLMTILFGNILTVSGMNLQLLMWLSIITLVIFLLMRKTIMFVAFDVQYARAARLPVETVNYMMIILVALTIVLNIRVVGVILVMSLLTIPQTIANIFSRKFEHIAWLSVLIGFMGSFAGLWLSYYFDIPSGATIIFTLVLIFALARIVKYMGNLLKIRGQINLAR